MDLFFECCLDRLFDSLEFKDFSIFFPGFSNLSSLHSSCSFFMLDSMAAISVNAGSGFVVLWPSPNFCLELLSFGFCFPRSSSWAHGRSSNCAATFFFMPSGLAASSTARRKEAPEARCKLPMQPTSAQNSTLKLVSGNFVSVFSRFSDSPSIFAAACFFMPLAVLQLSRSDIVLFAHRTLASKVSLTYFSQFVFAFGLAWHTSFFLECPPAF